MKEGNMGLGKKRGKHDRERHEEGEEIEEEADLQLHRPPYRLTLIGYATCLPDADWLWPLTV